MTAYISPIGNTQFVDANGNPLVGGKVYTYAAGTTTPIDAYTTHVGDVPQANPAILNSLGALDDPLYLDQSVGYKIVVKDADDVATGMEYDYVYGTEEATAPSEWILYTGEYSYLSSTQFSVVGDQTQVFQTNRHLKTLVTAGTAYHIVDSATYSAPDTTVTVTNTFLSLDTGLNQLYYGFFAPDNSSIPESAIGTAIRTATSQAAAQAALDVYGTGDTYTQTEVDDLIAAIPLSPSHNFRNHIVNGNFIVDQEYAAASTTFTSGAAYKRAIDMWYAYCTGANVTGQQITSGGGRRYRFTGAASNTAVGFVHSIEAKNSADLAGGDATLSVLLSSSSITTVNWQAYYANTDDTFGTLASPTRTSIASGSFTITSTETLYRAVLTGISSSATTGIEVVFTVGALTATNTLTFGNVQLEKGDIALADVVFETVEYSEQLRRCVYGFYEKVNLVVGTASSYRVQGTFQPKRATPTIGTVTFNTGSGATFSQTGNTIFAISNHSIDYGTATIPLICGLHG